MDHPIIRWVNNEVEDLNKAIGLDLRQPQGALAEGQCGLGKACKKRPGLVEGHSLRHTPSQIYCPEALLAHCNRKKNASTP